MENELKELDSRMYESTETATEEELNSLFADCNGKGRITCTKDIYRDYLSTICDFPVLTKEQEIVLFTKLRESNSESIREMIINCNLKLVCWIAKKIAPKTTIDIMDLIQEGNMGLIKAVEDFSLEKGTKFSTYATNWIKHHIKRYIESNDNFFRIPSHIKLLEPKAKMVIADREAQGLKTNVEDLVNELGCSMQVAENVMFTIQNGYSISLSDIVLSGENGNDITIESTIEQHTFKTPEESVFDGVEREILMKAINSLEDNCKNVLLERYGFIDGEPKTCQQIGEKNGVSRQAVSLIEIKALKKLKAKLKREDFSF